VAFIRAAVAALDAEGDRVEAAELELLKARRLVSGSEGDVFGPIVEVFAGHVDLARARASLRDGAFADAMRYRSAAEGHLRPVSGDIPNEDLRFARRLLQRALRAPANQIELPGDALVVDPEGRWFRPPGGTRVDLGRRRLLQSLLLALAQEHRTDPGKTLSIDRLVRTAWSDERIQRKAATNRLRVSIAQLRRRGLGSSIVFRDGGYGIDPRLEVIISPQ
jgi:hypothetical protein